MTSVHRYPGHPFAVRVERDGAAAALRLSGEFDVACESSFTDATDEALTGGTGNVRRTMEIAGLERLLPIADVGSSK